MIFFEVPARPTIGLGSTGKYVRKLQHLLNQAGASVVIDGMFGVETLEVVQDFQKSFHLKPSGIVGPLTWSALEGIPIGDLFQLKKQRIPKRTVTAKDNVKHENKSIDKQLHDLKDVTMSEVVGSRTQSYDGYVSKLIKYIPSEILAVYLTLRSFVLTTDPLDQTLYWLIFGFGILVTPFYIWRIQTQKNSHKNTNWQMMFISTGAFIVWAIGTGGPFDQLPGYKAAYGGILLIIYTFLIPLLGL